MNNYSKMHIHTMLSNPTTVMDSVNSFQQYIDRAVELNMDSICFTEHGNLFEWLSKKEAVEKAGLKYIHGVEAYITESLETKIRDNYHCILIAKNYEGFKELNYLMSDKVAFNRNDNHFYYQPRISFDELISTSNNIIISTACLGGILGKGRDELKDRFVDFLSKNSERCYLEIQHHNVNEQKELNKYLYTLHNKYRIPLIAGTDTHALNDIYLDGRKILQRSKNIFFENESDWDITFKSYDELVLSYKKQGVFSSDVYLYAIDNTNVLSNSIETFEVNKEIKYPKLYDDSTEVLKSKIIKYAKERNVTIDKQKKERIKYELNTYIKNGAVDYILLEEDVKSFCRDNDILYGYSRGSVSGSYVAYLLKITDVDSIRHNMSFERFMSPLRVSLADIDTDYPPSKRELVKEYLYNKKGLYCADIITFNTIADKGAIRDVGRALGIPLDIIGEITSNLEYDEDKLRIENPTLFKYVDLLKGVITSVSFHPCGLLVSPFPIEDSVSTFTTNTDKYPITQLNMKELDSLNFVKLDILGLDNIEIINKTCSLAGIERLTPDNICENDTAVWDSIHNSGLGIFQWEGDSAHAYYKHLFSESTISKMKERNPNFSYIDLFSIGNGAIRPAGASYRDSLANGEFRDNGHYALNSFLSATNGFLVFQEQIINFLNQFCGFSLGEADIVRRGFAKKTGTEQYIPRIKIGFINTMKERYDVSEYDSEQIIVEFLQIIQDASNYLFSENHAKPYSYIGYACAWLRHYYPLEFLTVMLDINKNNLDKTSKIMEYIKDYTNINLASIKFGKSLSEYTFDKDTNYIYKGIESIKYCNSIIAMELFELSRNTHESFTDILADIYNKTSVNTRQLSILIKLNYFSQFGNNKKLLDYVEQFNIIYSSKTIKKEKYVENKFMYDLLVKYSKQTDKQFKDMDTKAILKEIWDTIENKKIKLSEQAGFEAEHLGYIQMIEPKISDDYYVVSEIKLGKHKLKPFLSLYNIKEGKTVAMRIKDEKIFAERKFKEYDVLKIIQTKDEKKTKRINGKYVTVDEKELVIYNYYVV